ncbi:MAG: fibronectin type III domain-containing protein, partial [Gammaproteobacteria bacterium]|nr:fibronectin type III domain-containing protein [Gammaproteobacteria bacterium]
MQWSRVSGATSYNLGLRDLDTNDLVVDRDGYTGTSYSVSSLTEGHRYRWNVQACNSSGCSAYSRVYYFQIAGGGSIPEVPTVSSPGSTNSPGPSLSSTRTSL